MTNKEIVCLFSSYFRKQLDETTTEYSIGGADTLEIIDICLTFMITKYYKKPVLFTPKLAFDIYTLAKQWKVSKLGAHKSSLEKQLCEELKKNHEDLMYVCNLLIVSEDSHFHRVENCCIATLVFYHAHDFIRIEESHPLKKRLFRQDGHVDSLMVQVKKAYALSLNTMCFLKILED
ncbi:BTB domain-containing protein [Caenorhabditis elegans]|uniref:BTB domain-containing protein n=1 Tax=Caenorhabditis elegans TaxID=6239 RepID=Q19454_CAEEL|nr:BTB domain-containing protein [Caenorhabditis elegans]CAB01158.3 BTB domain-containing protein [Caenorhabditis elegans]|eukprot:NP_506539.3 Uncharacterized protein CELE_F14D7.1 [Caenorhabditis elegans]